MEPFVYTGQPCRVVFGSGASAGLKDEIAALGGARALFCCSPGRRETVERFAAATGGPDRGRFGHRQALHAGRFRGRGAPHRPTPCAA